MCQCTADTKLNYTTGLKTSEVGRKVGSGLAKAGHSTKADLETSVRDGSSELGLSYGLVGLS